MRLTVAQVPVGTHVADNKACILELVKESSSGDWLIFPEGLLSGYRPADDGYLASLDSDAIEEAIADIEATVREAGCHVIFGSAVKGAAGWGNAVISLHPEGPSARYHKIELSALDRRHFIPGTEVTARTAGGVRYGILACREVLFPAPWGALKAQGAQIVFHSNNAIQPHDARWDALFVARALENGFFVCSVNNCASPQALPSYVIAPSGRVLVESPVRQRHVSSIEIDLAEVIPDLSARTDY